MVWTWAFKANPVGEVAPVSSTGYVLNLRYAGQYFDAESGLVYNYHRYYDATIGRYVQSDPIGLGGGVSTYLYSRGSALRYIDPLRLSYAQQWAVGGGAIGGTVAAGGFVAVGVLTGGVNILATPVEIAGGAALGAGIGYVAGTVADWISPGEAISQSNELPELPAEIIGENERDAGSRVNTDLPGPAFPETCDGLIGGNSATDSEVGHEVCANGVRSRDIKLGPRIAIPANGDKPHETIHFPKGIPWTR